MATQRLTAEARTGTGKGAAKRMRKAGRIPAILYGKGQDAVSISLGGRDIFHLLSTPGATTNVLELEIDEGGKNQKKNVLIRKIQKHPFREEVLHLDLLEVAMDQELSVMVPIEVIGESKGVKEGGILELKRRELEVVCLPGKIPHTIAIDITHLGVGDSVHVEDIAPPEGVQIPFESNYAILSVVAPAVEAAPEEAPEAEEAGEVREEASRKEEAEGGEE